MRGFKVLFSCLLILFAVNCAFYLERCLAQESLTITTYYPSPFGSYRELRSQRIAIGQTYTNRSTACWDPPCPGGGTDISGNPSGLIVEGNVGIGLTNPIQRLDVNGNIRATGSICTAAGVCLGGGAKAYATTGIWANGEFDLCGSGIVPNLSLNLNLTRTATVLINGVMHSANGHHYYLNVDGNLVGPYNTDAGTITITKIWPNLAAGNHTISINYTTIDNPCNSTGYNNNDNVVIRFLEALEL